MILFLSSADLRQELAVRERTTDRMSAPSSPTLDIDKMDSAVQASLSLPATPVGKSLEHPFISQKGQLWFISFYCTSRMKFTDLYTQTGLCAFAALTNGCGNSSLTPSARISALNIVGDLLRKVGVGVKFKFNSLVLFILNNSSAVRNLHPPPATSLDKFKLAIQFSSKLLVYFENFIFNLLLWSFIPSNASSNKLKPAVQFSRKMFDDEAKHRLYFFIFFTGFGVQTRRLQELCQRPGSKKELLQRKRHTHQQQRHQVLSLSTHHLLWQNVSLLNKHFSFLLFLCFCLCLLIIAPVCAETSRTVNGLDPSSLTSMAATRAVSPPGMLPLSVWGVPTLYPIQPNTKTERTLERPLHCVLSVCVYVSVCVKQRERECVCVVPVWGLCIFFEREVWKRRRDFTTSAALNASVRRRGRSCHIVACA